jgi:hypothetical protein
MLFFHLGSSKCRILFPGTRHWELFRRIESKTCHSTSLRSTVKLSSLPCYVHSYHKRICRIIWQISGVGRQINTLWRFYAFVFWTNFAWCAFFTLNIPTRRNAPSITWATFVHCQLWFTSHRWSGSLTASSSNQSTAISGCKYKKKKSTHHIDGTTTPTVRLL